jgi:hypothetical protein
MHALLVLSTILALPAQAAEFKKFDTSRYSQAVTGCDRLAGHPDDPLKVVPGLERRDMDLEAAIAACRRDVQADPGNPRLVYQLARSLTYAGRIDEGLPLIEQSAAAKYPQSLFVTGYLYLDGAYKAPKEPCRAAALVRESALYGRLAGLVGFPAWSIEGRFKGCPTRQDRTEMLEFLDAAKASKPDFYADLLIDSVRRELLRNSQ